MARFWQTKRRARRLDWRRRWDGRRWNKQTALPDAGRWAINGHRAITAETLPSISLARTASKGARRVSRAGRAARSGTEKAANKLDSQTQATGALGGLESELSKADGLHFTRWTLSQ